jgi:hypothetical protein
VIKAKQDSEPQQKKPRGHVEVIATYNPDEEAMLDVLMLALGLSPFPEPDGLEDTDMESANFKSAERER